MYSFERVYFFSADGNGYRDKLIRYLLNDGRKTLYKNYANLFTVRALQVATHLVNATKICAQCSCILCTVYMYSVTGKESADFVFLGHWICVSLQERWDLWLVFFVAVQFPYFQTSQTFYSILVYTWIRFVILRRSKWVL